MGPEDLLDHDPATLRDRFLPAIQLGDAFRDVGIKMVNGGVIMSLKLTVPAPKGTVVVIVGPKPRPEDESAPNPLNYKPN